MRRFLAVLTVILITVCSTPVTAFGAVKAGYSTRFRITESSSWRSESGETYDTVTVEYQLKGSTLKGIQGTWFAVDAQKLLWVDYQKDEKSVQDSIDQGTLIPGGKTVSWKERGMWSIKEEILDEDEDLVDSWSIGGLTSTLVSLDAAGKTLYMCPQPMQGCTVSYTDYTTVMSFRFAVLPGAVLTEDSVRIIRAEERDYLSQSFISAMNDGATGYYYGNKSAKDTLSAPVVFWNLSVNTPPETEPVLPPVIDPPSENEELDPGLPPHPFTDIPAGAAYEDAIVYVYTKGLFRGMSETTFEPDTSMTRAMFVTVLGRLEGIDPARYPGKSFDDVEEGSWYASYVRWASEQGIVQGYGNGLFGVDDPLTVEQAVVIMARYAEYAGIDTTQKTWKYRFFDEKNVSSWAEPAMKWAVKEDLYQGNHGWLLPQESAKRSLLAQILYSYDAIS